MMRPAITPTDQADNKLNNYGIYLRSHHGRVLELGPYDGTDTVYLARAADFVISVEARPENATATRERLIAHGVHNAIVVEANLETLDLCSLGLFDCVWASGILYHVPHPDELIRRIAGVTSQCFGWTHLTATPTGHRNGYAGRHYSEPGDVLSGMSDHSWWLAPNDFLRIWADLGWECEFTTVPMPHPNGDLAAQFTANKRTDTK